MSLGIEVLTNLINKLGIQLEKCRKIMEEGDDDDDDWENTREYYEIEEDDLTDKISCLKTLAESFPTEYVGDSRARIVNELIVELKQRLKLGLFALKETQDLRIEKEISELREEIQILEKLLAIR